ncbi:MAG: hypothetical protein PUA97_01435 [bacterium]|nr:hypothetical protein [bacterium]
MKKVLLIVLVSLSLALPIKTNALDLKLTYKEDLKKCYELVPYVLPSYDDTGTADGYTFFASKYGEASKVFKLDSNNELLWKTGDEIVVSDNIKITNDDNTSSEKILITKYDDNNNVVFKTKWGGNGYESRHMIYNSFNKKGEHDGYIISFRTYSTDIKAGQGYILIKIDLKGNIVWQKNISNLIYYDNLIGLPVAGDKDKFTHIFTSSSYVTKYVVEITNYNQKSVWSKNTAIDNNRSNYSYNESGEIDGIVVVGVNKDNNKGTIIKYDLDGNEVFRTSYDSDIGSRYTDVISSIDVDGTYDGYIVAATLDDGKSLIIKYDHSGKIVWREEFSSNSKLPLFLIRQNYDELGNPNGYLFYAEKYENDDLATENCSYTLYKYTYPNYEIKKEATDEGDITVSNDKAYPGDVVKISVTPKDGYVLKKIVVTDESGKEIEVSDDGTFIMPEGKVKVSAIYNKITNPETVSACYIVLGIILLISIGALIVNKQKTVKNN